MNLNIILHKAKLSVVGLALCLTANAQPVSDYAFTNLTIKDGLSQLSVMQLHQDYQGYIWMGTRNGLCRYDGNTMKVYKHEAARPQASLLENQVDALAEDSSHHLWVANTRGLSRLDLTTDRVCAYIGGRYSFISDGLKALYVDKSQTLWLGAANGVARIRPGNLYRVEPVRLPGLNGRVSVSAISQTRSGLMLVGSSLGLGVYRNGRLLRQFSKTRGNLSGSQISRIHEASDGIIYVATKDGGLNRIDPRSWKQTAITTANSILTSNSVRDVAEMNHKLLVGTYEGLYLMDMATCGLTHIDNQMRSGSLSHFSVYSLLPDRNGGLWVGTYSGGVNYYSPYNNRFHFLQPSVQLDTHLGIYGQILPLGIDRMLVATEGSGLLECSRPTGRLRCFPYYHSGNVRSHNIVKSLTAIDGDVLCGTTEGEVLRFDPMSGSYRKEVDLGYTTSIYAIEPDGRGGMWLASSTGDHGLVHVDGVGETQKEFTIKGRRGAYSFTSLRCIHRLNGHVLLLGSRSSGLMRYDTANGTLRQFDTNQKGSQYMASDYVTAIVVDRRGRIFVATWGAGLYRYDDHRGIVAHVGKAEGLPSDEISMAVMGHDGKLWMSLGRSVASLDPDNLHIRTFPIGMYDVEEFSPHSGACLPDGTICFSASNGIISFNPASLPINNSRPQIVLNSLSVNNQEVLPDSNGILRQTLNSTSTVRLKYDQNNLSISYSALSYVFPQLNQYAFRLVGRDSAWNYVGNRHTAYFSNLPPGHYTFELKAANNDGVWSDGVRRLTIVISPPVWATWYAYLFYIVVAAAMAYIILYYINKKRKLEQTLQMEKREQEQREKLNRERMSMYTNFSHELRTPLQLILSPLEEVLKRENLHISVRNKLELIYNNAQRMLALVNKLMDLQKSSAGKMRLKVAPGDFSAYVGGICDAFRGLAADKNISLKYASEKPTMMVWFDRFLMEKVVFNLLSNAIKFTPDGGEISVSVQVVAAERMPAKCAAWLKGLPQGVQLVQLSVADNGVQVPDKDLEEIFKPFYQAQQLPSAGGTGIGLSLTSSVVALHHGIIWADNIKEGGAIFTAVLPNDKSLYKPGEIDQQNSSNVAKEVLPAVSKLKVEIDRRYHVLLVEDNHDVRQYIAESLSPYFDVSEAADGVEAAAKISRTLPDIIVSDVMMPRKNGLELCREVKENMATCQIPFIMMTARSFAEHVVEGYATGADDYIVKPFNIDVLITRICNLLKMRQKLKEIYGRKFSPEEMGIEVVEHDDNFVQRFFQVVSDNLSNPDLDVDMICCEIGVSRTNLYRKLKAATPLSPVELIRTKRLDVAAQLLSSSDVSMLDIAVQTGFSSQAYFSKCFRSQYGCTPSEYVSKTRKAKQQ